MNTPACQWKFVLCDAAGRVIQIVCNFYGLHGYANLTALPAGLTMLQMQNNNLTGTPDLTTLPAGLNNLDLIANQMTGTPNLAALPAGLQVLMLDENQFTGNGTFAYPHLWCADDPLSGMCGRGIPVVFDCTSGVWRCGAAW